MDDELLRAGLLRDVMIVIAGARGAAAPIAATQGGGFADVVELRCAGLGANVARLDIQDIDEEALAAKITKLATQRRQLGVLINDGASLFAHAGAGHGGLRACLDGCWRATCAVANGLLIGDDARGGRIINLAPPPQAGEHAAAAGAGLENLARTLSVEWARRAIVTTTIVPGEVTTVEETSALVAFLASPAGGYYSGCLFTLDVLPRAFDGPPRRG